MALSVGLAKVSGYKLEKKGGKLPRRRTLDNDITSWLQDSYAIVQRDLKKIEKRKKERGYSLLLANL